MTYDTPQRLRPLSVGELLDAAIKVCTAHAGTLLKAVLFVLVPVQVFAALVLVSTVPDADYLTGETVEDVSGTYVAGQIVIGLLGIVSFLLATGACFRAVAEGWLGRQPDWRESLRFALRRALPLAWVSILYFFGVLLGALLIVLPGIWVAVAWSVVYPVVLVEDVRGRRALGRSRRLVRGRWWASFAVLLLGFLLAFIVGAIFGFVFGVLSAVNESLGFLIVTSTVANLLASVVTTPFQAALVTVLYFDLRVRKEGFDLQLLAQRIGVPRPAEGFPTQPGVRPPSPWALPAPGAEGFAPPTAGAPWQGPRS